MNRSAGDARRAAVVAGVLLLLVYAGTGAATLTFWDAAEFATAIGTFGIPHPPGTPLYVAMGSALWRLVPGLSPVQSGTLLSALATSAACAMAAWLTVRITGERLTAIIVAVCAGAMGTVWLNATETEVYSVALLSIVLQLVTASYAHEHDDDRARVLVAYLAALSLPLHLSALVGSPAALLLANTTRTRTVRWAALAGAGCLVLATALLSHAQWIAAAACLVAALAMARSRGEGVRWLVPAVVMTVVAWTALLILLVRARQAPFLNQGDPSILPRLLDVVSRAQYDVAALWPRRAPFWLQIGNIGQYADWQVALSLWNDVTPSWWRTPFTLAGGVLGVAGAVAHFRVHRTSAQTLLVLFLLATIGVCLQLNLRAGPSFGVGVLAEGALHEARERDYFFAVGFWCWGLWIGAGTAALCRRLPRGAWLAAIVPLLMIAGNWRAISRAAMPDKAMASAIAGELLHDVPPRGMLFTAGDNDSYPLWYRQVVDSVRPDVQVIVTSLLPANWYFRESATRAIRLTADTTILATPLARAGAIARQQLDRRGAVAVSIILPGPDRAELGRLAGISCWRRFGLVDVGTRSAICPPRIDGERALESAQRLSLLTRASPRQRQDGVVAAFQVVARCPSIAAKSAIQGRESLDSTAARLLDITCNLR